MIKKLKKELVIMDLFSIKDWINLFLKMNFLQFFIVGGLGVFLNLSITTILTEFYFGRENYFLAYLIGTTFNLIFNFTLHTIITFKTKDKHKKRFIFFIIYNILMATLQATIVNLLVNIFGEDLYLLIIISIIALFFLVNFFVSKFLIFKN